mmetsp:Transcript_41652/g.118253  ORF Transcript_41652/g.118253 Transcript_41652/m.118253 type:complete len:88 (+) Transcript_41652:301-564(+)
MRVCPLIDTAACTYTFVMYVRVMGDGCACVRLDTEKWRHLTSVSHQTEGGKRREGEHTIGQSQLYEETSRIRAHKKSQCPALYTGLS